MPTRSVMSARHVGISRLDERAFIDGARPVQAGLLVTGLEPHRHPSKMSPEAEEEILHLSRKYHRGPIPIVGYPERYHAIRSSDAGVNRTVKRHSPNRLLRKTRLRQACNTSQSAYPSRAHRMSHRAPACRRNSRERNWKQKRTRHRPLPRPARMASAPARAFPGTLQRALLLLSGRSRDRRRCAPAPSCRPASAQPKKSLRTGSGHTHFQAGFDRVGIVSGVGYSRKPGVRKAQFYHEFLVSGYRIVTTEPFVSKV